MGGRVLLENPVIVVDVEGLPLSDTPDAEEYDVRPTAIAEIEAPHIGQVGPALGDAQDEPGHVAEVHRHDVQAGLGELGDNQGHDAVVLQVLLVVVAPGLPLPEVLGQQGPLRNVVDGHHVEALHPVLFHLQWRQVVPAYICAELLVGFLVRLT